MLDGGVELEKLRFGYVAEFMRLNKRTQTEH